MHIQKQNLDPTDGDGGRIVPWGDMEGKEIKKDIAELKEKGEAKKANVLKKIDESAEKIH